VVSVSRGPETVPSVIVEGEDSVPGVDTVESVGIIDVSVAVIGSDVSEALTAWVVAAVPLKSRLSTPGGKHPSSGVSRATVSVDLRSIVRGPIAALSLKIV